MMVKDPTIRIIVGYSRIWQMVSERRRSLNSSRSLSSLYGESATHGAGLARVTGEATSLLNLVSCSQTMDSPGTAALSPQAS